MNKSDAVVHFAVADRVATITLDSPDNRNALSNQLLDELGAHLLRAKQDESVRAVLLTATGTTFCSGADLKSGGAPTTGTTLPEIMTEMWTFPKPVVVKLNGHVRAGGTGLVAAADVVIAPTRATFAFSEVRIGVAPAIISVLCTRRMHPRAISRYFLTGEPFDGEQAVEAGLVTIAVDEAEVDRTTEAILAGIRLTEPGAVRITKELLRELATMEIDDAFESTAALSAELFASDAAAEGMLAFREKRPPSWAS